MTSSASQRTATGSKKKSNAPATNHATKSIQSTIW